MQGKKWRFDLRCFAIFRLWLRLRPSLTEVRSRMAQSEAHRTPLHTVQHKRRNKSGGTFGRKIVESELYELQHGDEPGAFVTFLAQAKQLEACLHAPEAYV